jgi:hypothetical protein
VLRNLALAFPIGIRFRMGKQRKLRKGGGYSLKREASVDSVTYPRYNGEMDALVYVDFPGDALVGGMASILVSWRILVNSGCF